MLACKEKPCTLAQRVPVSVGASPSAPKPEPRRRTRSPARSPKAMHCRTEAARVRASSGASSRKGSRPAPPVTSRPTLRRPGSAAPAGAAGSARHEAPRWRARWQGRHAVPAAISSPGPYSAGTVVLGQPSQAATRARCAAVASGCTSNCQYLGGSAPNVTARRCRRSRRATSTVTGSPGR